MSIGPGASWRDWPWPQRRAAAHDRRVGASGRDASFTAAPAERGWSASLPRRSKTAQYAPGSRLHHASGSSSILPHGRGPRSFSASAAQLPGISISGMTGLFEIDPSLEQPQKYDQTKKRPRSSAATLNQLLTGDFRRAGSRQGRRALTSRSRLSASPSIVSQFRPQSSSLSTAPSSFHTGCEHTHTPQEIRSAIATIETMVAENHGTVTKKICEHAVSLALDLGPCPAEKEFLLLIRSLYSRLINSQLMNLFQDRDNARRQILRIETQMGIEERRLVIEAETKNKEQLRVKSL